MRILIKNALVITMDEGKIFRNGWVLTDGKVIESLGDGLEPPESADRVIDARGGIVMPGLINAHTHAAMTILRGYADDLALETWLNDYIFPVEDKLEPDIVKTASRLACAEMIQSGTTTFADMYFMCDKTAEAVLESGMNANLSRSVTGMKQDYKSRLEESKSLFSEFHGAGDDSLRIDHSLHAVYTCGREAMHAVSDQARRDGTGIHIHLSETMKENRDCYKAYGKSPTEIMHDAGVFKNRTLAAHCVYLSGNDMDILKSHRVSMAHCPTSNLKLASGVANIKEIMEHNIPVALGTDGAASNNTLDLFGEIKLAALLHKGMRLDPTLIDAYQALEMATVQGAKALGREKERGMLKAGYRADLILLDPDAPSLMPMHNPVSGAVYNGCGGHVLTSIINGRVVMENREILTLDMEAVKRDAVLAAKKMGIQ